MKNKQRVTISLFALLLISISACKKEAGDGGRASITGKVWVKDYNKQFTVLQAEYYAQGQNVYIIYGDNTGISDKTKTSYDGSYEFPYLRKGKYTIFVVSKDSTSADLIGDVSIIKEVEITTKKQTILVPQITIIN